MSWEDELDHLARERGPALVGYAYLLTGDLHTAQDLVQEALVRTFVRRRSGAGVESLESYVRRTVLNVYRDLYRRRRTWAGVRYLVAERSWYEAVPAEDVVPVPFRLVELGGRQVGFWSPLLDLDEGEGEVRVLVEDAPTGGS